MSTQKVTIGALIVAVILLGVLAFKNPSTIAVPTSIKLDSSMLGEQQASPIVNVPAPIVNVNVPKQTFGSATGPQISSPWFSFGDVNHWASKVSVSPTGSTTCAIQSPPATTTLVTATASYSRLASTTQVEIGYATTPMATTTSLGQQTVLTTGGVVIASTTLSTLVVAPNAYINVKIGGGSTAGTVTPLGTCVAVFREVY